MTAWIATTRFPASSADDLEELKASPPARSKKAKAQLEAAKQAAVEIVGVLDAPCNVAISGFIADEEDSDPDQVHVHVSAETESS